MASCESNKEGRKTMVSLTKSVIFLAAIGISMIVQAEAEAAAPPPLAQYRSQHPADRIPQNRNAVGVRPTPEIVRSDPIQWDLPYAYNARHLGNLEDPSLLEDIVYDVNVGQKGLTAVKDEELQACFIDHYIVPFVVPRDERRFYTHTLPGVLVDTPRDRAVFKNMMGETIYDMCHQLRNYWLDNALYFRYTKLLATSEQQGRVRGNHPPAQSRAGGAPHPGAEEDAPPVRRPPPVSLYHVLQQQGRGRNVPLGNHGPAQRNHAPPPVAEYRRQHPQHRPGE